MAGHKKKKKPGRVLGLILLLALALAAVGYFALIRKSGQTAVAYKAYTAQVGTISNASSFSGSLALIDDKTYAATSSATVRNVYVSEGDSVSEGDRLMRLSNGQTITADFDGRVNKLYAVKDDEVAAGDSLLQIADFDHMLVSVRVDEYDISDVSVGQACRVTTTATEKTFESEISSVNYISSNTNGNVAYYAAEARVDVNGQAYPGMQVTLTIPKEEAEDVIVLKMDAISFDQTNQAFVWVQDENGAMTKRAITVGVSNGNYVEVKSGLSEGETVYAEAEEDAQATGLAALFGQMGGGQQPPQDMGERRNGEGQRNGERAGGNGSGGNGPGGNGPGGNGGGSR